MRVRARALTAATSALRRAAGEALLGAQAREQDACCLDSGQIREQQRFARASGEVAARQQLLEPAAGLRIDGLRFLRQRAVFEDPQDEAVHRECCQAAGPDLE